MVEKNSGAVPHREEIDVIWDSLKKKPLGEASFAPADSRQLDHFSSLGQYDSAGKRFD